MKRLCTLFALLLAVLPLSACVRAEMTDVVSFCKRTKTPQSAALSLTDCLTETADGERRFFWALPDGLALRLICTEDGRIAQCRVLLQRGEEPKLVSRYELTEHPRYGLLPEAKEVQNRTQNKTPKGGMAYDKQEVC